MTVLIDPPQWPGHGRHWSHLASDTSFEELHAFARELGVPARGFEGDHYDIPSERYAQVVAAGAVPVASRELLRRLHASALRRPKRRGEKVVASLPLAAGPGRVDTVESRLRPRRPVDGVVLLAVHAGRLLALPGGPGAPAGPALSVPRLPVVPVAPGDPAGSSSADGEALADLLRAVLRAPHELPAAQVGYLRYLGPGPSDVRIELVVHVDGRDAEPIAPATWSNTAEMAEANPALAPLIGLPNRL